MQLHSMAVSPPSQAIDSTLSTPKPKGDTVGWLDLPNKDQLFVLAVCRLSEPLSNVCLLPYIFYLVQSVLSDGGDTAILCSCKSRVSPWRGFTVAWFCQQMVLQSKSANWITHDAPLLRGWRRFPVVKTNKTSSSN